MKPFCNKCYSFCCLVISIWGVVQLPLMGVCLYFTSPAFYHDLKDKLEVEPFTTDTYYANVDRVFKNAAISCWVATGINVVVGLISFWQFRMNQRYLHPPTPSSRASSRSSTRQSSSSSPSQLVSRSGPRLR